MTIYSTDGSVSKDSSLCKWLGYVQDGMKRIGLESEPGLYLEKWVKDVGFTNVHHKVFPYPVGPWPKDKTLVSGFLSQMCGTPGLTPLIFFTANRKKSACST